MDGKVRLQVYLMEYCPKSSISIFTRIPTLISSVCHGQILFVASLSISSAYMKDLIETPLILEFTPAQPQRIRELSLLSPPTCKQTSHLSH